jgi:branched-chain amino acid transport system substrate-binding protein
MATLMAAPCWAGEAKELKIGGLFCLKGLGSEAETHVAQGAQIAVDWLNEQGGIEVKGQKYKLNLIVEDMAGTADGASMAANKLAYDHQTKFVVGTVVPFMVTAAGTVLEPARVLRVAVYNCFTPAEYGPKTPYMFVSRNATVEGIDPSLDYLKEAYPKAKRVTYVIPDDGSVRYLDPLFHKKAKAKGLEVASIAKWAMDTQDFTPVVTGILAAKPDAIAFANGWPAATGAMLKVAREMGFNGPVFGCNYDDPYQVRQIAGKGNSHDFFIHALVMDSPDMTPMIKMLIKLAKEKYGVAYAWHGWGFNAVYVLSQAIEAAQSLDPTEVKNTWEKMDKIKTIYGPGRMGGKKTYGINHTVTHPSPIAALVNGEVKWVRWMDVYTD